MRYMYAIREQKVKKSKENENKIGWDQNRK